jgi:phage tail-like protein
MGVQGQSRDYLKKFLFRVEMDGLTVAGFTTCSDIGGEMGVIAHMEGGDVEVSDKSFGRITEKPITLTVGATDNNELWQWWQDHYDGTEDAVKKTIAIVALNRDKSERFRHNVPGCFITDFIAASYDASAEENVIQSITLEHDRPDLEVAAA